MERMPEALEPVDSPAYQWFVRFKYIRVWKIGRIVQKKSELSVMAIEEWTSQVRN